MLVEGWLARAAAARPAHAALLAHDGACSYGELLEAASARARELHARGARRGERVATAPPGGPGFAQALHARLLLGAVAVPVDVRAPGREQQRLAAGAAVVVDAPLGDARTHAHAPLADLASASGHDLEAPALVMHTSGTGGAPRPVELTYGNLLWSALGSAAALDLDADERWLCAMPVCHVGGLSILVRSAIYATTAVVHARFDTERALAALREEGITLASLVATTLTRLLDAGLARPASLRCALTGGGPVPQALIAQAVGAEVPLSLTYGLTEASSQVTTTPVQLRAPCAAALAPYKVPREIELRAGPLPRTRSGKLLRAQLTQGSVG